MFQKAKKDKLKLRLLIEGASGSGKTWSSLLIAQEFGKKIALIDTEKGSGSLYSSVFNYDVCELKAPYTPEKYIEAISFAEKENYDVIIIDSITHEWSGEGGCLDIHSNLGGYNSYTDWKKVTPRHNSFLEKILSCKCHVVATARTKSDISIVDKENKQGKLVKTPVKVGLKTEQRDGLDYEFTTVLRLSHKHCFDALKDRTGVFTNREGEVLSKDHAKALIHWLLQKEVEMLRECETLDELKGAFSLFDSHTKRWLESTKNEMKARLKGVQPNRATSSVSDFDGLKSN